MEVLDIDRAASPRQGWLLQLTTHCRRLAEALSAHAARAAPGEELKAIVDGLPPPRSDLEQLIGRCALAKALLGDRLLDGSVQGRGRTLRRRVVDYCLPMEDGERPSDWANSAELLGMLRVLSPGPVQPVDDAAVAAELHRFIAAHYTATLTDARISAAVNVPAGDALRAYKRTSGRSVRDAIADLRFAHARRLLVSTDLKISAIASEVGYRSPKDLYRLIKARTGLTPARLRQAEVRRVRP